MTDQAYGIIPIYKTKYEDLFLVLKSVHGHWTFPKGHIEGSETPDQAARRELREETAITEIEIPDPTPFFEYYTFERDGHMIDKTNTFVIGYVTSTAVTIQKEEIVEYRWVTYTEACEFIWPSCKKLLGNVHTFLTNTKTPVTA